MISEASIYPNPFDSRKTHGVIAFTLNRAAPVKISIYDVFGSRVREIKVDGAAGANNVLWDGSGSSGKVSKGVYLCVIKAAGSSKVLKVAVKH
jgi:flagellar hook assembly protein FlgD